MMIRGAGNFFKALIILCLIGAIAISSGCSTPKLGTAMPEPTRTMLYTPTITAVLTPTPTPTPLPTFTPTPTPPPITAIDYGHDVKFTWSKTKEGDILINNTGGPDIPYLYTVTISFVDNTGLTRGPATAESLAAYGVSGDLCNKQGSSCIISTDSVGILSHVVVYGTFGDGVIRALVDEYV